MKLNENDVPASEQYLLDCGEKDPKNPASSVVEFSAENKVATFCEANKSVIVTGLPLC